MRLWRSLVCVCAVGLCKGLAEIREESLLVSPRAWPVPLVELVFLSTSCCAAGLGEGQGEAHPLQCWHAGAEMGAVPGRRSHWDRAGWEGQAEKFWFLSCFIPSPSLMGIPFLSCQKRHSQALTLIPSRRGSGREHTTGCSCPRLWSSHLKGRRAAWALLGCR